MALVKVGDDLMRPQKKCSALSGRAHYVCGPMTDEGQSPRVLSAHRRKLSSVGRHSSRAAILFSRSSMGILKKGAQRGVEAPVGLIAFAVKVRLLRLRLNGGIHTY